MGRSCKIICTLATVTAVDQTYAAFERILTQH
jgi:hypothetical protein